MAMRLYGDQMIEWDPKPRNDQTWWMRSHCGPGSLDEDDLCDECGKSHRECAEHCTQHIKDYGEGYCFCSGFWCPSCGVFYAQDSCLEVYDDQYETLSGKKVHREDNDIFCDCGLHLFPVINGE